ncbi:hypothetical protein G3A_01855 [Bacillus sp. 17376]|nr:hypothetical protein [Mesobacillus boroniphilus]ESU34287.1 hypothetical protein G3A_01855 [Bacillus sp. 17376]
MLKNANGQEEIASQWAIDSSFEPKMLDEDRDILKKPWAKRYQLMK